MQAHELKPTKGSRHARKRVGRGNAAGTGTYSGRGLKGQKSRAGRKPRRFFEGGQTRLMRRLPRRRGFTNHFRKEYQPVNLRELERFEDGSEVTPELLKEAGIIDSSKKPVKILSTGEITRKLTVRADRFSLTAREKIEAAGGTVDETEERKPKKERKRTKRKKGAKAKQQQPQGKAEAAAEEGEKAEAPEEDTKAEPAAEEAAEETE
jgi:large subunit ribosomal protein L15